MDTLSQLSLLMGTSWVTGLNAYAAIGFFGLFHRLGWLQLPPGLDPLANSWVFGIALFLFVVEFIADKIPAVDTVWDSLQTFIRIPAGAVLAYAAVGDVAPELKVGATLLGGSLAFSAHATKSSLRAAANLSPEPFSNWALSLLQDVFIFFALWFAVAHPILLFLILAVFLFFFFWFAKKIFRGLRWMLRKGWGLLKSYGAQSSPH